MTLLGGGFGRKSKPDYVVEAALLSKAMDGAPVKVTWTREDDIHNDYFHTVVGRADSRRGSMRAGQVVGVAASQRAPPIQSTFVADPKHEAFGELGMGLIDTPFAIPNLQHRESRGGGTYAHRLVPLGLQHPACVRDPVLRRRAGRRGRPRPEGFPARADRPGAPDRPTADEGVELQRVA